MEDYKIEVKKLVEQIESIFMVRIPWTVWHRYYWSSNWWTHPWWPPHPHPCPSWWTPCPQTAFSGLKEYRHPSSHRWSLIPEGENNLFSSMERIFSLKYLNKYSKMWKLFSFLLIKYFAHLVIFSFCCITFEIFNVPFLNLLQVVEC